MIQEYLAAAAVRSRSPSRRTRPSAAGGIGGGRSRCGFQRPRAGMGRKDGKRKWSKGKGGHGDLSEAKKGHVIVATCDSNRGREASRELSNLISQVLDEMDAPGGGAAVADGSTAAEAAQTSASVSDAIEDELRALKQNGQPFRTLHTKTPGLLCAVLRKGVDVVEVVERICRMARDGQTSARHVVRLIPLQLSGHANEATAAELLLTTLHRHFTGQLQQRGVSRVGELLAQAAAERKDGGRGEESAAAEEGAAAPAPAEAVIRACEADGAEYARAADGSSYMVAFNRRHHAVLHRDFVKSIVRSLLPPAFVVNYKAPQAVLLVEAIKGVVGVSYARNFAELEGYNIRKLAAAREDAAAGEDA